MDENIKKGQDRQLKKLSRKHREVIELIVEGHFPTDRELADFVGVAPETLCRWKSSEVFKEELERRLSEEDRYRRMRYRAKANHAADKLFEMMEYSHIQPRVAMQAILKVLELADGGALSKEEEAEQGTFGVVILPDIQQGATGPAGTESITI